MTAVLLAVGIGMGVAVIGAWVAAWRGRRERRRQSLSAGQIRSALLPNGEFAVWVIRPFRFRLAATLSLNGGFLRWTRPRALQPEREVSAGEVGFRVLRPSRWVDLTRVRLLLPGSRPVTVIVSREARRPVGGLDPGYAVRLDGYVADFIDLLRRAGAAEADQ